MGIEVDSVYIDALASDGNMYPKFVVGETNSAGMFVGSDYSDRVVSWPKIRTVVNELKSIWPL